MGNFGLPLPEEGVLVLARYLVWAGTLRPIPVLVVGILCAVIGDTLGYCFGHHYGQKAIRRYGHILFITPDRLIKAGCLLRRYGSYAVFLAAFFLG